MIYLNLCKEYLNIAPFNKYLPPHRELNILIHIERFPMSLYAGVINF